MVNYSTPIIFRNIKVNILIFFTYFSVYFSIDYTSRICDVNSTFLSNQKRKKEITIFQLCFFLCNAEEKAVLYKKKIKIKYCNNCCVLYGCIRMIYVNIRDQDIFDMAL